MTAFEKDIAYRLLVEAVRVWVVGSYLGSTPHALPEETCYYVYANGAVHSLDWGNVPGKASDGLPRPLRGKRIRVTLSVEQY